jgi:signal transduction histidine kinase
MDRLAGLSRRAIEASFVVAPLLAVLYLWVHQVPPLMYKDVPFHELAVGFASVMGLGIAAIALRCHADTGERFALYLGLGLGGFSILYGFHGAFTRVEFCGPWLFLLYGPASRLVLAACLVIGLMVYDTPPLTTGARLSRRPWLPAVVVVGGVVPGVVLLAASPVAGLFVTRLVLEGAAMALCLAGIVMLLLRERPFPMRAPMVVALSLFLESSAVFLLTGAWTHVWWAAHLLLAGGFLVLAHGILRVYLGTRSFATMFSEDEMLARLSQARDVERTLRAARDAAEMANRAKTEFLASMSHELRTPLNAVIGFAETMKLEIHGPLGSPKYLDYADSIGRSGAHLLALINDILDVSRVEEGHVELMEEEVDLEAVVADCLTLVRARAHDANVHLETVPAPDPPCLWADGRRMKQVLLNLVGNAVKFTPEGGRVRVSWFVDASGVVVRVSDTGIGIEPRDLEKVMTPFGQADSGLARKYEGSGLGLPLAKAMVELHGGVLLLQSTPGRGTTVTVTLPLERLRGGADPVHVAPAALAVPSAL